MAGRAHRVTAIQSVTVAATPQNMAARTANMATTPIKTGRLHVKVFNVYFVHLCGGQ